MLTPTVDLPPFGDGVGAGEGSLPRGVLGCGEDFLSPDPSVVFSKDYSYILLPAVFFSSVASVNWFFVKGQNLNP